MGCIKVNFILCVKHSALIIFRFPEYTLKIMIRLYTMISRYFFALKSENATWYARNQNKICLYDTSDDECTIQRWNLSEFSQMHRRPLGPWL